MVHLYKQDGDTVYGIKEYVVDTPADIAALPRDPKKIKIGSTALVISTGDVYMLNGGYQWSLIGGNSSGGDTPPPPSDDDDNNLIEF